MNDETYTEPAARPRGLNLKVFAIIGLVLQGGYLLLLTATYAFMPENRASYYSGVMAPNGEANGMAIMSGLFAFIVMFLPAIMGVVGNVGVLARRLWGRWLLTIVSAIDVLGAICLFFAGIIMTLSPRFTQEDFDIGLLMIFLSILAIAYCIWGIVALHNRAGRTYFMPQQHR